MGDNKCLQTNILRIHRQCRTQRNVHVGLPICARTLFLVYEFRHEAADPSCLSAENQNLRHGSWFIRGGHGWYGHNAPNEARGIRNGTMAWPTVAHHLIIISEKHKGSDAVPFSNAKRLVCHASVDPCPFSTTAPLSLITTNDTARSSVTNDTAQFSFSCRYLLSLLRS